MGKKLLKYITLLYYGICLFGVVGFIFFPTFMIQPVVRGTFLACIVIIFVLLHTIRKLRKESEPTITHIEKILMVVCLIVGVVLAIVIRVSV
jgi:hypothetical protein